MISIAQLVTDNLGSWPELVTKNKIDYAKKHGYGFFSKTIKFPKDRHPSWYCIPHILDVFSSIEDGDWVFWSDIDSLIMKTDIELSSFIDESYNFIVGMQGNGTIFNKHYSSCLNLGQFFIKNTHWSKRLLNEIWSWAEGKDCEWEAFWENCVFNMFWKKDLCSFRKNSKIVPIRQFNSFYDIPDWTNEYNRYVFGDFIVHFTSKTNSERDILVREYYKRVDAKTNDNHIEPIWWSVE